MRETVGDRAARPGRVGLVQACPQPIVHLSHACTGNMPYFTFELGATLISRVCNQASSCGRRTPHRIFCVPRIEEICSFRSHWLQSPFAVSEVHHLDKMRASSTIEDAVFGSKYTEQGQDA